MATANPLHAHRYAPAAAPAQQVVTVTHTHMTATSAPLCFECGSANPCHCKMFGPLLGFVVGVCVATVAYPIGGCLWCVNRPTSTRLLAAPADIYHLTNATIPI
ncbi:hypothetical protein CHLRE_03g207100v5 [Chlamydomonas reinhardtii]|uniref:Uncharacterized protein n=1 Tax=Chlamydomonas reinhardtii TaxID=3055 RepID=A8IX64_CHLRE|nr:uncharacterized protein CHLRE_03g207100v5 [Chlamydomonas reinhardtii]PNW85748.1 hypothetical protein CHLRE_03g207100v5 [Chlamydomonas reinhardtii]|eukprot:XP_001693174.1 predicted protein [Chlamydomonas reinhardtii]